MLFAENTPNNLGVTLCGDQKDFEYLYEALHMMVEDEEYFSSARIRVLGICYDIRHALMGNREYQFVENGLTNEIKKYQGFIASDKNVYLKIYVLWPEMLFVLWALNDFSLHYAKKITKNQSMYNLLTNPKLIWDRTYIQIREFQAAIADCIQETVMEHTFTRLINTMNRRSMCGVHYFTQYIDLLNIKFSEMDAEKRLKNISVYAKRIAEQSDEYQQLASEIRESAKKYNCSVDEIRLKLEYPEDMEW